MIKEKKKPPPQIIKLTCGLRKRLLLVFIVLAFVMASCWPLLKLLYESFDENSSQGNAISQQQRSTHLRLTSSDQKSP